MQPATDSSGNIDADTLLDPDSAEFFPLNAVEANLVSAQRVWCMAVAECMVLSLRVQLTSSCGP